MQSRKATPGGAAQAARRSVSEMSQTAKQRSRLAPERGCLRQQTGVEMARLRSKRRGPGDMPGTRPPPNDLTKKCSSEHRRGRGTLQCKVGKRLEHRRGSGIRPDKKGRPRNARSASEFRRHRRILFKHDRLVLRHKSLHDAPCKHISDTAEAEHDEVTALLAIETEEGERRAEFSSLGEEQTGSLLDEE